MEVSRAENKGQMTRRDFLGMAALWSFAASMVTALAGIIRLPKPSVFPEASRLVRLGAPEDYPLGTAKVLQEHNIIVAHDEKGLYAVSLVCTHLGCIVNPSSDGFLCPCHGSRFDRTGRVVAGPAPRALEWVEIARAQDGSLVAYADRPVSIGTHFAV